MPIYEYTCSRCQEQFELLVRGASEADRPPPCPGCGTSDTHRILSGFAVAGQPRADPQEIQANQAQAERKASITPKEQIDKWRAARRTETP